MYLLIRSGGNIVIVNNFFIENFLPSIWFIWNYFVEFG